MSDTRTMQGHGRPDLKPRKRRGRITHRLEPNWSSTYPERMIFFDTETRPHREPKGKTRQDFRLGVACYWRRSPGDAPDVQEWKEFGGSPQEGPDALTEWEGRGGPGEVTFAETIATYIHYQIPTREMWSLVKADGWAVTKRQFEAACREMRSRMLGAGYLLPASAKDTPETKVPGSFTHDLRWEYARVGRAMVRPAGGGESVPRFVVHYSVIPLTAVESAGEFDRILDGAGENEGEGWDPPVVLTLYSHYISRDHRIGGRLGNLGEDSGVVGRASDN